jgi:ubiquinone/menaquinone biosynthesis C-methylase UbiE
LLDRAPRWEPPLLRQIDPRPRDVLVDVGCGWGDFTARLAALAGGVFVIGVDADVESLARARAAAAGLPLQPAFVEGRVELLPQVLAPWAPTKIVLRHTLQGLSAADQRRALAAAHDALAAGGEVHVAAFGTTSGGRALAPDLAHRMRQAGFRGVEETARIETADGLVALLRGAAL